MSERTHDPATYEKLDIPLSMEEADERLSGFFEEVRALRIKHGVPDVHLIARMKLEGGGPAISSMHFGAVQEAEGMVAWAFARAGEERRHFINHMKAAGIASSRG